MTPIERYLNISRRYKFDKDYISDGIEKGEIYRVFGMLCEYLNVNVEMVTINSTSARNEIVYDDNGKITIVWDTGYWGLFQYFMYVSTALDQCENKTEGAIEYSRVLDLLNSLFCGFLSKKYYHTDDTISLFFAKEAVRAGYDSIGINDNRYIDMFIFNCKLYVLVHELLHVRYDQEPVLKNHNMGKIKETLEFAYECGILTEYKEECEQKTGEMLEFIINNLSEEPIKTAIDELTIDIQSLFELNKFTNIINSITLKPEDSFGYLAFLRNCSTWLRAFDLLVNTCLTLPLIHQIHQDNEETDKLRIKHNIVAFVRKVLAEPILIIQITQYTRNLGVDPDTQFKLLKDESHKPSIKTYYEHIAPNITEVWTKKIPSRISNENYMKMIKSISQKKQVIDFLLK